MRPRVQPSAGAKGKASEISITTLIRDQLHSKGPKLIECLQKYDTEQTGNVDVDDLLRSFEVGYAILSELSEYGKARFVPWKSGKIIKQGGLRCLIVSYCYGIPQS